MNIPFLTSLPNQTRNMLGLGLIACMPLLGQAQQADIKTQWQHAHYKIDGFPGVSSYKAHEYMKSKGKQPAKVVVAIIDSGSETWHKDLKQNIWTNTDEVPNNGIDDDKNGYIDDVHGWSFIGGKDGDVAQDNLEITRIYRALHLTVKMLLQFQQQIKKIMRCTCQSRPILKVALQTCNKSRFK